MDLVYFINSPIISTEVVLIFYIILISFGLAVNPQFILSARESRHIVQYLFIVCLNVMDNDRLFSAFSYVKLIVVAAVT